MQDHVIAYWLLPSAGARTFFAQTLRDLAARFQAPVFQAHLTLLVVPENLPSPWDRLPKIKNFSLTLAIAGIRFSEQFTKTLFVQFEKTDALQKFVATTAELIGADKHSDIDPHLSLLYKKLSPKRKTELASSIELPFSEVTFDSLCAMRCASPTRTADDVRAWQLLIPQNSKTR